MPRPKRRGENRRPPAGRTARHKVSRRTARARRPAARRAERILAPLRGTLSVIVSARNEQETLQRLLKQVACLHPAEIIVVLNGCSDNSFESARQCKEATIVHCPASAGHDVGRAIGAKLSKGDILLFLDGDMVIPAPLLLPFAAAVDSGIDVALNDLDTLLPPFGSSDSVTRSKLFLNYVLGRKDLGVSSMTAVPHALSRRALETIGCRELMVPPKAQAISILKGLRVEKAGSVDVIKHNRLRQGNTGVGNGVEQLIAGDHAEALQEIMRHQGAARFSPGSNLEEHRRQVAVWRNGI
ncbi:glycosyltransferase [Paenibacillus albidus]|uniref:glycosyltransferase family 2 protein n=1 Tax=Paenibacillus albidus TaxID=2041023 RepID=UPI001BE69874|nr:glycosyltransferase [Paenibacillus albidus]MBT2292002.1 glycosyltransferase [Paenibacillus albidus]